MHAQASHAWRPHHNSRHGRDHCDRALTLDPMSPITRVCSPTCLPTQQERDLDSWFWFGEEKWAAARRVDVESAMPTRAVLVRTCAAAARDEAGELGGAERG